jgi:uncharacterized OB-fold protein
MMAAAELPYPVSDSDSAEFWAGCANGQLLISFCAACYRYFFYPRQHCPRCGNGTPTMRAVSGLGSIYAWTRVHRAPPAFRGEAPYVVALVDLDEGVRLMTRIDALGEAEPRVGARVHVQFRPGPGDFAFPWFVLGDH